MPTKVKKGKSTDPFKGKLTEIAAIPETTVVPKKEGTDLYTKDDTYDAHIRLEGNEFIIDIFNSKIGDADKAYIGSQDFPNDENGANEAMVFLKQYGFSYKIMPAT